RDRRHRLLTSSKASSRRRASHKSMIEAHWFFFGGDLVAERRSVTSASNASFRVAKSGARRIEDGRAVATPTAPPLETGRFQGRRWFVSPSEWAAAAACRAGGPRCAASQAR